METKRGFGVGGGGGGGGFYYYYIKLGINWPKRKWGNTRYSGTSIQEFPPLRSTILAPKIKRHKKWVLFPYGKAP
jgi:hypothetical protein